MAQLKINADWVGLSACNAAAGETPGAEALSGLARASFTKRKNGEALRVRRANLIINARGLRVVYIPKKYRGGEAKWRSGFMLLPLKSTPSASAKQLETGLVGAEVPYAMIVKAGVIQKLCECLGLVILVVGVCPNFIEG